MGKINTCVKLHETRQISTKRALFIFIATTLVLILTLVIDNRDSSGSSFSIHQISSSTTKTTTIPRRPEATGRLIRSQPFYYGVDGPRDPRFYNIIPEEEALTFPPCKDINQAASTQYSKVSLADHSKDTYAIGETIRAVVTLFNGYGKRKYSGGDQIRATIESNMFLASAPCVITDNRDGTHAVFCEALWSGDSKINVSLAYTREVITRLYDRKLKTLPKNLIYGTYMKGNYTEDTPCHPIRKNLLILTSYTEICDLTSQNSGMPFFCGRPSNENLLCEDLQVLNLDRLGSNSVKGSLTDCERKLFQSAHHTLEPSLSIYVANRIEEKYVSVIDKPSIPCSQYNVSLTWHSRRPTGFFYGGKWNLRNCLGTSQQRLMSCLRNRRLYLIGDSTVRQWFTAVLDRFKCKMANEDFWKCPKCQKKVQCTNKDINFETVWYQHGQPNRMKTGWYTKNTWYSTSYHIDKIPREERAIVLIHIYLHVHGYHSDVFKQRMQIIRKSVENYLSQSKHSIVLIKAPHTHFDVPLGDFSGYVFSKILFDVFDGLHDKVVLLNNRDATQAQHEVPIHPRKNIVNAMVDQMMSYVCN
ncbi:NXPE family member 4-like [Mercenaria mercenaria]|uniref:NXPE family member 4-like n=1 Tax=Mercenaria mercenaria TaxID=6596 RepID=UPI00234F3E5A|nr:NXPE family member 4-like [Mercenaria mercenaria]